MAFQPLFISWSGKGEVKTLTKAEWLGGIPLLGGEALLCAFYLNELLMKLLPREDAHEILFDKYAETIRHFSNGGSFSPVLRRFEKFFLKELGYELVLDHDASTGQKIDPLKDYTYDPERGPMEARHSGLEPIISGRTLLSLAQDELEGNKILAEARALMRLLINHRLDSRPLNSRKVFLELLEL